VVNVEPTTYDEACEYRRELEPKAIVAEREAVRRRFVRTIEAAERRLAQRKATGCTVEGCSGDLASPESCCDACVLAAFIEAQRAAAEPMVNPWMTADGRYFSSDVDAKEQQRWLSEKRQRQADRIAAYARGRGVWTDRAEADFIERRYSITDAGRAALAETEAAVVAADRVTLPVRVAASVIRRES
jgi:hypothetical protein